MFFVLIFFPKAISFHIWCLKCICIFLLFTKGMGQSCTIFLDFMDSPSQTFMKWPLKHWQICGKTSNKKIMISYLSPRSSVHAQNLYTLLLWRVKAHSGEPQLASCERTCPKTGKPSRWKRSICTQLISTLFCMSHACPNTN